MEWKSRHLVWSQDGLHSTDSSWGYINLKRFQVSMLVLVMIVAGTHHSWEGVLNINLLMCTCLSSVHLHMQLAHACHGTWPGSIQGPWVIQSKRSQIVQLLGNREREWIQQLNFTMTMMMMMVMTNSITETSKHPTKTSTKSIVISVFVESHKNIQYNNQLKQFIMSFVISVTSHKNTGRPYLQLGTSQAN